MKSILPIKMFLGLVEMTFGLVYSRFSLPEWQGLKMTFFAPRHCLMRFAAKNGIGKSNDQSEILSKGF